MHSTRLSAIIATLVALAAFALPAWAQTYTWINNASGVQDWHTPANWSPAAVPPPGATVIIPVGTNSVQIAIVDVTVT